MKKALFLLFPILPLFAYSQCPFNVSLNTNGNCLGASLNLQTGSTISQIIWYNGSSAIDTVSSLQFTSKLIAGGNGQGAGLNQFDYPNGIYVDAQGNVYVSDVGNNRVLEFPPGATNGIVVAGGNGAGSAPNQLNFPRGLYVDGSGNIYVVDMNNNRVQEWVAGAAVGITVAGGNGAGNAANQLNNPMGLFVDPLGDMYIADQANNRVQEWLAGATTGITVAGGNGAGPGANQLNGAIWVFVDATGNVYVSDQNNNRVQKWPPGATSGITVAGGNGAGAAANQLYDPVSIFVDANGNLYICDYINDRVQEWAAGATSGITIASSSLPNQTGLIFSRPTSLFVDAAGNVYITCDGGTNSVQEWGQIYSPVNTSYTPLVPGYYYAKVTDNLQCSTGTDTIIVNPMVTPAISISTKSTSTSNCAPIVFNASAINGGAAPVYQWTLNGANVGTNSPVFSTSNLPNGSIVQCALSSNATCTTTPVASSNLVTMTVVSPPTFYLVDKGNACVGDSLIMSTTDSLSQIIWKYNGIGLDTVNALTSSTGITVAGGNGVGYAPNQINRPFGIFMDASNNLYVVDETNHRIQKWAPGATAGVTVAESMLADPNCVFVDASGNIYVSDLLLNSVIKFPAGSNASTPGVTIAGGNGIGNALNQLNSPRYMYVDPNGNLFVVDQYNERVLEFPNGSSSATNGIIIVSNLINPIGLFGEPNGILYIGQGGNGSVLKWVVATGVGNIVAGGNGLGSADNQFGGTGEIYVDATGNIYVADEVNNRVMMWAPGATTGTVVAGGNGNGAAANQLSFPEGLFLDAAGNVYATDYVKNSVQKWVMGNNIDTIFKANNPGTYTAYVTDKNGCTFTSNPVVISPSILSQAQIVSTANNTCKGLPISFTATEGTPGLQPSYSWLLNGASIGVDNPNYNSSSLTDSSVVQCVITSRTACLLNPSDSSNKIIVRVSDPVTPSIQISVSKTTVCDGTMAFFQAAALDTGNNPSYQWEVNGIATSNNGLLFSSANLKNGDIVNCMLNSSLGCTTANPVLSNNIAMQVVPIPATSVSLVSSATNICEGDEVVFTAQPQNPGTSPLYHWVLNDVQQSSASSIFTSSSLKNGDQVFCTMTSSLPCAFSDSSSTISMVVNPVPTVVFVPDTVYTSLNKGVQLVPILSGNITQYQWVPNQALDQSTIPEPIADPANELIYQLTVTTDKGCVANGKITVIAGRPLEIPNAFTPNGDGRNDVFRIPLGVQFDLAEMAVFDRWGNRVFDTKDINKGWDGTFHGMPADAGTYVYSITGKTPNGKSVFLKGTIILIR